jgi:hypothetical protein
MSLGWTLKHFGQYKEGLGEPPSRAGSMYTMLCEVLFPPHENRKYTSGRPPARTVNPAAKL